MRKTFMIAAGLTLASISGAAYADHIYEFNDGNGTCGLIECGSHGCSIIEQHNCPREVDPNG